MKREGRQHGMVRTHITLPPPWNSRPKTKVVNEFDSPPTAGLYTKVWAKPTNHSKFTGKCGKPRCMECHTHPACKSRNKAKGTQKLKSCDVAMNHRLVSWRVVDKGIGLNYTGISATVMLSNLSGKCFDDEIDDDELRDGEEEGVVEDPVAFVNCSEIVCGKAEAVEEIGSREVESEEDDDMGFYSVGLVWDCMDDDGDWCLVGEM